MPCPPLPSADAFLPGANGVITGRLQQFDGPVDAPVPDDDGFHIKLQRTGFEEALCDALANIQDTLLAAHEQQVRALEKELAMLRERGVTSSTPTRGSLYIPDAVQPAKSTASLTQTKWRSQMEAAMKGSSVEFRSDKVSTVQPLQAQRRSVGQNQFQDVVRETNRRAAVRDTAMDWTPWESLPHMEGVVGAAIIVNSIVLGLSMDIYPTSVFWIVLEVIFASLFLCEAGYKMCQNPRGYLFGPDWRWNVFEVVLVVHSFVEIPLSLAYTNRHSQGNGNAETILSNVRFVRLVRFARILRLGRINLFKDLVKIFTGAMGGSRTLFWSILIIMVPLYMMALALRESLGGQPDSDNTTELFSSLPMSMFTVFRCIVAGECTTESGQPIFQLVTKQFGWGFGFLYCICMLLVVFGLFNVITAIYIDNTLSAAKYMDRRQKQLRLLDQQFVSNKQVELLEMIWKKLALRGSAVSFSEAYKITLTPGQYAELRQDERFQSILRSLDICDEDQVNIFETLDVDESGTVDMEELLQGITKMRGDARRSDIVGVILMVKSLRSKLDKMSEVIASTRPSGAAASVRPRRSLQGRANDVSAPVDLETIL